MDMNSILTIVGIVVLLGVAGGCVFGVLKIRQLLGMFDATIEPKLNDVKTKTAALKPAVAQVDGLMGQVNLTLDALDVELLKVDDKLDQLSGITDKVSTVTENAPKVMGTAKTALKTTVKKGFRR
ncbi:MAG: hypothetical protein Q4D27_04315 [Coriobacteriia bacterium]|nr:hypothetical protein [Coriobacteriia bacterium]